MPVKRNEALVKAWTVDQIAKSVFFHRKLHEWKLLEVVDAIDRIRGEALIWTNLGISEQAWNKVIHQGIKPVTVFAHPVVLRTVQGSSSYYRMMAMVSQKSMKRIGVNLDVYEAGKLLPNDTIAYTIALHLNKIISLLVEADDEIDLREFDLWRGMAAGSQAQGSWQNNKGVAAEIAIREVILRRLQERKIALGEAINNTSIRLSDQNVLVFADEPDIAIYENHLPTVAVEIKGGIDQAGVLERIGAALKSLQRTRQENPASVTVLVLTEVSITERAKADLDLSIGTVNHLFSVEKILEDDEIRETFFQILGL